MKDKDAKEWFYNEAQEAGLKATYGVADFTDVLNELIDVQKERLRSICGDLLPRLEKGAAIVSLGLFHTDHALLSIGNKKGGKFDKTRWNIYSREYRDFNQLLDRLGQGVAERLGGIPIQATLAGYAKKVGHARDYFPLVVSHRSVAIHAGLGWRGKNGLLVTKEKGCALRLTSVIVPQKLEFGQKLESFCGSCNACLNVCIYLRKKEVLEDYREDCRKRLNRLGLEHGGCGLCIRACFEQGQWKGV